MIEIYGDLWDYYGRPNHAVFIATNGFVKTNGEAVMGRGCALEAKQRIPSIAKTLGDSIKTFGNVPQLLQHEPPLFSFPVKYKWWEKADLDLIRLSITHLNNILMTIGWENTRFVLPRPGCGNGLGCGNGTGRCSWP